MADTHTHNLRLNCLVLPDASSRIFPIDIESSETVADLMKAIKKEKEHSFKNIDADSLILWKVSIDCPPENVIKLRVENLELLQPMDLLSEVFSDKPQEKRLHIVVRPITSRHAVLPIIPFYDELRNLRRARIDKLPRVPLSTLGLYKEFSRYQHSPDGPVFHFPCPPSASSTIPATLHHSIFGQFVHDCKTHIPTKEDNALVLALWYQMSQIYGTKAVQRAFDFRQILAEYGIDMKATTIEDTTHKTAGDMQCNHLCYVIAEAQQEIGADGTDPLFQAMWCYQESMKQAAIDNPGSSLPCLLIYLAGPHLGFAGAVYTDRPNVQILSASLPLFWHHSNTPMQITAARQMGALRKAIRSLQQYYEQDFPVMNKLPPAIQPNPCFPDRSYYISLSDSSTRHFRYVTQESEKLIFFAKTYDGEDVRIKFVHSYSKEAYEKCFSMGFAPVLKGLDRIPEGGYMVVTNVVTDEYRNADASTPAEIRAEIEGKLVALHQAGYVHGDVTNANLMVRKDGTSGSMLMDFDRSGKIGEVRYSIDVEDSEVVCPGELIKPEHDIEMLRMIFEQV